LYEMDAPMLNAIIDVIQAEAREAENASRNRRP
jgi:hypothetical protein